MNGQLKTGSNLQSESGIVYSVQKMLGAGGQGEVYDVTTAGQHYALKWYFKHTATEQQKKILQKLIDTGKPSDNFLWPEDIVADSNGNSFGYIMPLRPVGYKNIVDLMKRRAEPSFLNLCKACYNLTQGYQLLHKAGYQYRDISFGNVFFNPDDGEVLICDNDNVVPNGEKGGGVLGTPRFMAPEIVRGEAYPSRTTDQFSLAVLLFYMLFLGHPLEGALEANIKCMDVYAMNELYGTNPMFIYDPTNNSNRPVPGYQDNPIIYWQTVYPSHIKELFIRSFTVGLNEPNRRVTEKEWLNGLALLIAELIHCPKCGAEVFCDLTTGEDINCWDCRQIVPPTVKLAIGKKKIAMDADTKIFAHYLNDDYDMTTVAAEIARNPKNPNVLGIRNNTGNTWQYKQANGSTLPVESGRTAAIAPNAEINFGRVVGHFER